MCTRVLPPVPAGASLASLISSAVAYTREPNQVKPSLPLFWDCEWSHEYDRWYYINEKCVLSDSGPADAVSATTWIARRCC